MTQPRARGQEKRLWDTPARVGQRRMNLLVPSDQVPTIVDVRCGCTDVLHPRMRAGHCGPQADRVRRARIRALQEPEAQAMAVGRIGTMVPPGSL